MVNIMKFNEIINKLRETKFVDDRTIIRIVVSKGKSIKKDDEIFECDIPVKQAEYFFGDLCVTLNQIRGIGEMRTARFWFLLACDEI